MVNKISNLINFFKDFKIENEGRESRYTSNASSKIHSKKHNPENGNIANLRDMILLQIQRENLSPQNTTFVIIEFTQQCQAYLSVTNERGMVAIECAKHEHNETFIM